MEIACKGQATLPFLSNSETVTFNFSGTTNEKSMLELKYVSASAFGAILNGDNIKPLVKQRLTHTCLRYVKEIMRDGIEKNSNVGLLMVVCHLVCSNDFSCFDNITTQNLAVKVVHGLTSEIFQDTSRSADNFPSDIIQARILVVITVLKFIRRRPEALNGCIFDIVAGLMRSYGVSNPYREIGCKVLTLQALGAVANLDDKSARAAVLQVKPAVTALLSMAISQRSVILRSAAVDVRNTWCLVI